MVFSERGLAMKNRICCLHVAEPLETLKTTVWRDSVCTQPRCRGKRFLVPKHKLAAALHMGMTHDFHSEGCCCCSRLTGQNLLEKCSLPWVRFRCRRLLFLLCIVQASCGAMLPRVKPDKRSVSLVVYVWSFLEDRLVFAELTPHLWSSLKALI